MIRMKGLELSELYYNRYGKKELLDHFPFLMDRIAVGLAGEGSECLGFDDEVSKDHDWGPGFCIWMEEDDFLVYGSQVQSLYDSLPAEILGYLKRISDKNSKGRVGAISLARWMRRFTGLSEGPKSLDEWRIVPESFLGCVINGKIFYDGSGHISRIRERLGRGYPEDVRLKKMAARAACMAQAGQYNYPRLIKRGELVASEMALAEFLKATFSIVYLLNHSYAPFYKWMRKGISYLEKLSRVGELADRIYLMPDDIAGDTLARGKYRAELIENICILTEAEIRRQGLSQSTESFLMVYALDIMEHIKDPIIRKMHVMAE